MAVKGLTTIRREADTAKLIEKIRHKTSLPVFSDIFDHPDRRLPFRSPVWLQLPASDFSVGKRWREAWDHSQVTNHCLTTDPTARVPGFDLHDASGSC